MLNKIKLLLGLTDDSKDELLMVLIERAEDEARVFCHRDDIVGLDNCIISMVVYNYNRIGTEGLKGEDYSGITFNYTEDYPDSILRTLKAFRKIVIC